jgi:hypothetical protein
VIKAIIKLAVNRMVTLIAFLPLIYYITYVEYESILVSTIVSLILFMLWYFYNMHWKGREQTKHIKKLLHMGFPFSDDNPLISSKNGSYGEGWEQGFGYTDDKNQPMWVKVNEKGISAFYLCVAGKKPLLFPWEKISQIRVSESLINQKLLAKIYIPGVDMNIMVPWNRQFDQFVPKNIILKS